MTQQAAEDFVGIMRERVSRLEHSLQNLLEEKERIFAQIREARTELAKLDRMIRASQPRRKP